MMGDTTGRKPAADRVADFTFTNCANKSRRVSWILALAFSQRGMHGPLRQVDSIIDKRVGGIILHSMWEEGQPGLPVGDRLSLCTPRWRHSLNSVLL